MEVATKPTFLQRHPVLKDGLGLVGFIVLVVIGTALLNAFVFRSFNVVGSSMENTLHSDDRIIVNRLPVTIAHLQNKDYVPERGNIIVFVNPNFDSVTSSKDDNYIIKRVIAFPDERVVVKDGVLTVYNDEHPRGFRPDDDTRKSENDGPKSPVDGAVDVIVPRGEIFVSGDNRTENNSHDSRNGLGTVPFYDIVGPATFRFFPFDQIRFL
jgi:signal peptidase I